VDESSFDSQLVDDDLDRKNYEDFDEANSSMEEE
jgi:hypothetical protein